MGVVRVQVAVCCLPCGKRWTLLSYRDTDDESVFLTIAKRHGWLKCDKCGRDVERLVA